MWISKFPKHQHFCFLWFALIYLDMLYGSNTYLNVNINFIIFGEITCLWNLFFGTNMTMYFIFSHCCSGFKSPREKRENSDMDICVSYRFIIQSSLLLFMNIYICFIILKSDYAFFQYLCISIIVIIQLLHNFQITLNWIFPDFNSALIICNCRIISHK